MSVLSNLEPKEVFENFEALSMIPRRTFRDEKISDFCVEFAKKHGLEYVQDHVGNVIIYKPGTEGYENSEPVILQGHMDMVASKTPDSDHDFDTDPLDLFIEDGYVGARNTTLGGDDGRAHQLRHAAHFQLHGGLGVADGVAELVQKPDAHGGHVVALALLKGRKIFNIDGELDGVLNVGCAGGTVCDVVIPVSRRERNGAKVTIRAHGYLGGHSGNDIQRQRGNAIKDMGRLLYDLSKKIDFSLMSVNGGNAANVIAQYCTAEVVMSADRAENFVSRLNDLVEVMRSEYQGSEPGMVIEAEIGEEDTYDVFNWECTVNVIWYMYGAIDGVQAMERNVPGAVESSLNTGIAVTDNDSVDVTYQVRSSIESKRDEMVHRLGLWSEIVGGHVVVQSAYPAWPYNPESELRAVMEETYRDMFGSDPEVSVIHAGLEGGILMGKNPDFDIVTFGPEMLNVHTPGERLNIESTRKNWEYLKEVLARLK